MRYFTLLLIVAPLARAHDLWLIPPQSATPGRPVTVEAVVGMDFPRGEAADAARFVTRRATGPAGDVPLTAGDSGLLRCEPAAPGVHSAAVVTAPKLIDLSADEFNHYLVADGLPHIYLLRFKEKTLNQPSRERYSKSPKCLVRVGNGGGGEPTKPMGLPLEIVPLVNPFGVRPGGALPVRVLFQGRPLAAANLGWARPGDGELPAGTARTDGSGEALIPISKPGLTTIRLTHMTRPKAVDHEWESFWTTLTWHAPH